MKKEHEKQIMKAVNELKEREKISNFYFVACGGSQAVLMAGQYMFDKETDIPAYVYTANEFVYNKPKALSENSVVITCSHSGTTPETIEATKLARNIGAITISLSNVEGSPLWKISEYPIHYDWGKDVDASDLNKGILYGLLFNILDIVSPNKKWQEGLNDLNRLEELTVRVKEQYKNFAKEWGKKHKRDKIIYTIGSGMNYGEMYSTALCWFMEMQWINSGVIHSGEYFHGPFEITDYDMPLLLVKSIGNTRYLDQRVEDFSTKFSDRVTILDQKDFNLEDISENIREYIATILSGVVIRQLVEAIAFERGHSLDVRRYMWQMEY